MLKKRLFRFIKWFFGIVFGLVLTITAILYFYKDDIIQLFIAEMNKHLKAKVQVSEVDLAFWGSFPNLSVDFNHVFIQDSYETATEMDTLLYSDRIRLKFNPMDLWRENYTVKSVEVSPGTLQLKVNAEGLSNYDILKVQDDSLESKGFEMKLESFHFEEFRVSYENNATDQVYRTKLQEMQLKGAFSSSVFTAQASSDLTILEARSGKVTLIRNQPARLTIGIDVNQDSNTVIIPASTIFVAGLPFSFNGNVTNDAFKFHLAGKNINIADAANSFSLAQSNDVRRFEGKGKVLFELDVLGNNVATAPATVTCSFGIRDGNLKDPTSNIRLKQLNLEGKYSNKGGKEKEFLALKNIAFTSPGGPFKGNLMLSRFDAPRYEGNANGSLDLSIIHALFQFPGIAKIEGGLQLESDFVVSTHVTDQGTTQSIEKCEGQVVLHKVSTQLTDDKRVFEDANGLIYLRNDEVGMENVSLRLNNSDVALNGVFQNVVGYFKKESHLLANVVVKSRRIDIADLGAESKEQKQGETRAFVLPSNIEGNVLLSVGQMNYEGHAFKEINGEMTVKNRLIRFPRIAVKNGGTEIKGSLSIEEKSPEYMYLSSQLVSRDIDFKPLFKEWNNFNQDVIKSENISGRAQANLSFDAPFDLRNGIVSNAINATIGIQIDEGRLKDVSTFKIITESLREPGIRTYLGKENINVLEKKLLDLRFEQLSNTLIIKNGVLTIPTMSIASSALDVEVSGQHSFKNEIDYRFGFRLRDLKAKKESEFGTIIDDGTGMRVYMRMYGTMDNPIVEWDKTTRKLEAQENRAAAKADAKSILKTEFGLFKNDTTVKRYVQDRTPHEELILDFNPVDSIDEIFNEKAPKKKNTWVDRKIKGMRKESEIQKREREDELEIQF